tara:strand:- start:507 stop:1274 length:768 start_codon:yes stop_codon:yes gene_type:complete
MFPSRKATILGGAEENTRYALQFDGTDDYVTMGDITLMDGYDVYSLSYWMKTVGTTTQQPMGINKGAYNIAGDTFGGYWDSTANTGTGRFRLGHAKNFWYTNGTYANGHFVHDKWIHHVITWSNTNDRVFFYANGVQIGIDADGGDGSSDPTYESLPNTDEELTIGRQATVYLHGMITDVAVYNSELSQAEVTTIYNNGKPYDHANGVGTNLVGWWRMGDGTEKGAGSTIYDMSTNSNNGTLTNMVGNEYVLVDF